jgi:hypothetical protein
VRRAASEYSDIILCFFFFFVDYDKLPIGNGAAILMLWPSSRTKCGCAQALLAVPAIALLLTGCMARSDESRADSPPGAAAAPACRADSYRPGDKAPAQLAPPGRLIRPGDSYIMNYSPDRLNLDIDQNGIITRVWCG